MTKAEFIAQVATKAGITKGEADKAVKAFQETIKEAMYKGEKVQLTGFGSFEISERAAREGRNPQTGESMMIKASKNIKFKAGKELKDCIN